MKPAETAQLLDECLQRMQMGETLESILKDYPQQAAELRPLLESAQQAQAGAMYLQPVSGMMRSRARFLEAAAVYSQPRRKVFFALPRFASGLITILVVVLLVGFGVALASDRSLPGQPLYGVKRSVEQAQLALSGDALSRLSREDAIDRRRVEEVRRLILSGNEQAVEFSGLLTRRIQDGLNQWSVDGIEFTLSGPLQSAAPSMAGAYVDVRGLVRGQSGLEVSQMSLRLYQIGGILQSQTDQEWIIEGVRVRLPSLVELIGTPEVGKPITVTAIRVGQNDFLALSARAGRLNAPATPTFTPDRITPTLTESVGTATLAPQPSATPRPIFTTITPDERGKATDDSGKDEDDNSGKGGDDHSGKGGDDGSSD